MAGPKLEPRIADRLLDLLGDSDKFRELFQQSPATALELIGHVEPDLTEGAATDALAAGSGAISITSCLTVRQLASKETIQAARHELRSMLLAGLSQITPNLDATYRGE